MAHKILIVEDDTDDQVLFIDLLNEIDPFCECPAVGNGAEAMDYLSNTNTLPSLILLDLNMPLMNGYEFLSRVKTVKELSGIPIAIFSTSNLPDDRKKTTALGASYFFTKSSDIKTLKANLVSVLFNENAPLKRV